MANAEPFIVGGKPSAIVTHSMTVRLITQYAVPIADLAELKSLAKSGEDLLIELVESYPEITDGKRIQMGPGYVIPDEHLLCTDERAGDLAFDSYALNPPAVDHAIVVMYKDGRPIAADVDAFGVMDDDDLRERMTNHPAYDGSAVMDIRVSRGHDLFEYAYERATRESDRI